MDKFDLFSPVFLEGKKDHCQFSLDFFVMKDGRGGGVKGLWESGILVNIPILISWN